MRTFMHTTALTSIMAGLFIAGCGSKESPEPEASTESAPVAEAEVPPREASFIDACRLTMTAPDTREWQTSWDPRGNVAYGEGPSTVKSTYWGNDDERRALLNAKASPFEVTCSYENADRVAEVAVGLAARGALTEADIPFGPGTYPIVPRSNDANAPKGLWAFPLLYGEAMFEATGGTLTITRFDDKGAAGSFRVEGKETLGERRIVIDGTFDMPCRGGIMENRCTAGKAIVD